MYPLIFNLTDPLIMEVQYQEIEGVLLPTIRRFTQAVSWEEPVAANNKWVDEICTSVQFGVDVRIEDIPGE